MNETWGLEPNTSFNVEIEHIYGIDRISKIVLKREGIVPLTPELLRNADPNLLQSFGDGTYIVGLLKLSLIMPKPLYAILRDCELFLITIENPDWRNDDGSPYLLEPK